MNFDYLQINSQDRDSGSVSSTDFEVSLSQALEFDEIQLNTLQLPYTVYNSNSTNNTLVVNWNSSNTTLTITPGNYTMAQLATALNTAVGTINSSITCVLNSQQWTFTFSFASASPATGKLVFSQSTINRLIGFPSSTDTANTGTLTSTSVALFMDQSFLFISIDLIGTDVLSSTNNNKFSFYVPITVNGGDMLTYQPNLDDDNKFKISGSTKYKILRIRVFDVYGNILNINGSDWSMVLKVFYNKEKK